MSCQRDLEKIDILEKYSKYNDDNLIIYNEGKFSKEAEILMKKGYQDMAIINLELASIFENELDDVNQYETWLCGE